MNPRVAICWLSMHLAPSDFKTFLVILKTMGGAEFSLLQDSLLNKNLVPAVLNVNKFTPNKAN